MTLFTGCKVTLSVTCVFDGVVFVGEVTLVGAVVVIDSGPYTADCKDSCGCLRSLNVIHDHSLDNIVVMLGTILGNVLHTT